MPTRSPQPLAVLLGEARRSLTMSQEGMGERFVASRKTVSRWESGRAFPAKETLGEIACAVHPLDADLAAKIAAEAGQTLRSLGLVKEVPQGPTPPSPRHLVDSVVCAAADAIDVLPRTVRPAVLAAFRRARELGLEPRLVEKALLPEAKKK